MKANITFDLRTPTDTITEAVSAAMDGNLKPARDAGAQVEVVEPWPSEGCIECDWGEKPCHCSAYEA